MQRRLASGAPGYGSLGDAAHFIAASGMSAPYQWVTPRGEQTAKLVELIRRARAGERWEDIGATFSPTNAAAAQKACSTFTRYASAIDKQERRDAFVRNGFNRNAGSRVTGHLGSGIEPALQPETSDLWAGMGACFARRTA